jgi:hypothetical protein
VQREIRRGITDLVLRILRVVTAEVGGRLADGAASFTESGGRLGRLAREQLEGGRTLVEIVNRLATETQGLTRGQKELRRHVDRIHVGAAQLAGIEAEVAERIASVEGATTRLRDELARVAIT